MNHPKLFEDINDAEDHPDITEVESICINCRQNGTTKFFLTKIPFFKEVVVTSFECPHCNYQNNELQPASKIQERGIVYTLKCEDKKDLNRKVVKTEWAEINIPEVEFEVKKQAGLVTTVEGIIDRAFEGLGEAMKNIDQSSDEDVREKMLAFMNKLSNLREVETPFTFILSDMSGNSFIENLNFPKPDPLLDVRYFLRSPAENHLLGCLGDGPIIEDTRESLEDKDLALNLSNEVLEFPTNCGSCNAPCMSNMKVTKIPHFREIIIMATSCDVCGYKNNEIKSGSGIQDKGIRIMLKVIDEKMFKQDVVQSDTCTIKIPELELEMPPATGSGYYTTVEGLKEHIKDRLKDTNPLLFGDSTSEEFQKKMDDIVCKLDNLIGLTVILDDPCGNTYVESPTSIESYTRTFEQNEELGLNDMKTENY